MLVLLLRLSLPLQYFYPQVPTLNRFHRYVFLLLQPMHLFDDGRSWYARVATERSIFYFTDELVLMGRVEEVQIQPNALPHSSVMFAR